MEFKPCPGNQSGTPPWGFFLIEFTCLEKYLKNCFHGFS